MKDILHEHNKLNKSCHENKLTSYKHGILDNKERHRRYDKYEYIKTRISNSHKQELSVSLSV